MMRFPRIGTQRDRLMRVPDFALAYWTEYSSKTIPDLLYTV